jgi:chromosome segregation ATPase
LLVFQGGLKITTPSREKLQENVRNFEEQIEMVETQISSTKKDIESQENKQSKHKSKKGLALQEKKDLENQITSEVKPDASADLKKKRDAVIATIYDADADMLFHFDELGKLFNKQIVLLEEKVRLIGE